MQQLQWLDLKINKYKIIQNPARWVLHIFSSHDKCRTSSCFICLLRPGLYPESSGWWWCDPIPSEGWGHGGIPCRPSSRTTHQGLNQRSKMEVVPKMARQRGSDAGQSRRRRVRSCRGVRRRCRKNSPSVLSCIGKRIREGCDRGSEVRSVHSRQDGKGQFLREN